MPKKPTKKKTYTAAEYEELRASTVKLAQCVYMTLASGGKLGVGSGMVLDTKTKTVRHWSTEFFDALDSIGLVYDREAFFKPTKKRRR